jgi:hypothetical protein
MRACEHCGRPLSGRSDKRFHDACKVPAWRRRKRDEAFFAQLDVDSDDGVTLRAYEEAEAEALANVRWKRSRGAYDAEWAWARFRVAELTDDPTKPFREQDEWIQRDAREVPD